MLPKGWKSKTLTKIGFAKHKPKKVFGMHVIEDDNMPKNKIKIVGSVIPPMQIATFIFKRKPLKEIRA